MYVCMYCWSTLVNAGMMKEYVSAYVLCRQSVSQCDVVGNANGGSDITIMMSDGSFLPFFDYLTFLMDLLAWSLLYEGTTYLCTYYSYEAWSLDDAE